MRSKITHGSCAKKVAEWSVEKFVTYTVRTVKVVITCILAKKKISETEVTCIPCCELVYDRNHSFGLGPIQKQKPKLADTFGRYRKRYRNYILKRESSYR